MVWFHRKDLLCVPLIVAFAAGCHSPNPPGNGEAADLILRNGKIVTMDAAKPEAEAIAVRGDKIVAVVSNREIERFAGKSTKIIDLAGKLALPGFIDGHAHLLGIGQAKQNLDLTKARNWGEVVSKVRERVQASHSGDWIIGWGWHQEKWDRAPAPNVRGFPTHHALSAASPDNPVWLTHASGHAAFANAKAMKLAAITRSTSDPPGGEILRDAKGDPIGLFRESAQKLVTRNIGAGRTPEEREAGARKQAVLANEECLSKGITSFQDAGSSFDNIDLYKKLVTEGALRIRLWVMIRENSAVIQERLAAYKIRDFGDHRLTVGGIKKWIDGALGSRGAWLLEPYTDSSCSTGLNVESVEEIRAAARVAIENRLQLCVHAIGDRANRETLNIFEDAIKSHPEKKDWRWRIEHVSVLHPQDIPRFGRLGVIASMQGYFCPSDAPYVASRLGPKRCEAGVYVWQKLLQSGALIVNGSDAPVEDVSPIVGFHASVTRQAPDGSLFYPNQRMTRQQALRSYTLDAAFAAFEESTKGSLVPGKLADITVLSRDIMTVPDAEILTTKIVYTIVGGRIQYKNVAF